MQDSFIFSGNTGRSYDQLRAQERYGQELLMRGMRNRPRNVMEGINGAANNVLGMMLMRRAAQSRGGKPQGSLPPFANTFGPQRAAGPLPPRKSNIAPKVQPTSLSRPNPISLGLAKFFGG